MLLLILMHNDLQPCKTDGTVQKTLQLCSTSLATSESQRHLIGAPGSQGVSRQAPLTRKLPDNRGAVGCH